LNLFSPAAFYWVKMLAVEAQEQLPVQAARAGDAEAWNALLRRFQLPLYVYAFELVRNEQDALDIVQETFLNAIRHLHRLRDDERFGPWLFSIAHQKVIQHWRRARRADRFFAEPLEGEVVEVADLADSPVEGLIHQEREQAFLSALAQLPPPQRTVLLLHFVEDFSLQDIANITGTPQGTVKSRLYYAKQALRKLIQEHSP
jgi:RNA polymerase sigma-70 factor (ECF subfamily)